MNKQFTKDNIVGCKFQHKDGPKFQYEIIAINPTNYNLDTKTKSTNGITYNWPDLDDINRWVKEGLWKPIEQPSDYYEVFN